MDTSRILTKVLNKRGIVKISEDALYNTTQKNIDTGSPASKRLYVEYDAGAQATSMDTPISFPTNPTIVEVNSTNEKNGTSSRRNSGLDDPITASLMEIQTEIGQLSNFVRSTFSERGNDELSQHNLLINRKDDETVKLKAELHELRESNKRLTTDYLAVQQSNEQKTSLIKALQTGIESTSKLQAQAESDLSSSLDTIQAMKGNLAKLSATKLELAKMSDRNKKITNEYQKLLEKYRNACGERDSDNRKQRELDQQRIDNLNDVISKNIRMANQIDFFQKLFDSIRSDVAKLQSL